MKIHILCFQALCSLAIVLSLCIPVNAAGITDSIPSYEIVVPLEFNQIYQVSAEHELLVVERYGSYREPQRALVTFRGEEVLSGTDILLCSDGILCRTRDWNEVNTPVERYSFYDWSLTPVIPETSTRIVTTGSHNLLLIEMTNSSAHANLVYGERKLFDIKTGTITDCGYGSDGDEITLPDGTAVIPDLYGYAAFTDVVGKDPGHLQLSPTLSADPGVYSSNMQQILYAGETEQYICHRNDTVCRITPAEYGNVCELLYPLGQNVITTGPLMGESFNLMNANRPDNCYFADDNNLAILRSAQTLRCGVIRILKENSDDPMFLDVPKDAWFHAPVNWAMSKGITEGTKATTFHTGSTAVTFSPDTPCTRAQIVTFLWRAAGCPEPKTSICPFTDINCNDYFYQAVLWAVENNITYGTSNFTFSPNTACTRAQAVTFLWRQEENIGFDETTIDRPDLNSFTDVAENAYYCNAVQWAQAKGITDGTSDHTFSPEQTCLRSQIITFLYRALKK